MYFLARILKANYNGYEFSNPKKSALYAIASVILSACLITGLMILVKSENTASINPDYNLGRVINIIILWLIMLLPILIAPCVRIVECDLKAVACIAERLPLSSEVSLSSCALLVTAGCKADETKW